MLTPEQFIEHIKQRKLFYDCTNIEKLFQALNTNKKIYLGIDPTYQSLHLGHYLSLLLLERFSRNNYSIVVLFGNFTSLIGDPSFRNKERTPISKEQIDFNMVEIKKQVLKICPKAEIIKNLDFYQDLSLPNLLNDVTKFVNVGNLIDKEFLKEKLKTGLSVSEFLYPIFQGYDFYYLYKNFNVSIQLGGSDQWGNIVVGTDLIRKKISSDESVSGLTFPLLVDENNNKFGKSANNALFLDSAITKPYAMFQYLYSSSDIKVDDYLKQLTLLSLNEISEIMIEHQKNPKQRHAQYVLTKEIMSNIYCPNTFEKISAISKKLFTQDYSLNKDDFCEIANTIPTIEIDQPINLSQMLINLGFASSSSEARRLIDSSCIYCFDVLITSNTYQITQNDFKEGYLIVKKGKKDWGLVILKSNL